MAYKAVNISTGLKFIAGWSKWDQAQAPIEEEIRRHGDNRLRWEKGWIQWWGVGG